MPERLLAFDYHHSPQHPLAGAADLAQLVDAALTRSENLPVTFCAENGVPFEWAGPQATARFCAGLARKARVQPEVVRSDLSEHPLDGRYTGPFKEILDRMIPDQTRQWRGQHWTTFLPPGGMGAVLQRHMRRPSSKMRLEMFPWECVPLVMAGGILNADAHTQYHAGNFAAALPLLHRSQKHYFEAQVRRDTAEALAETGDSTPGVHVYLRGTFHRATLPHAFTGANLTHEVLAADRISNSPVVAYQQAGLPAPDGDASRLALVRVLFFEIILGMKVSLERANLVTPEHVQDWWNCLVSGSIPPGERPSFILRLLERAGI